MVTQKNSSNSTLLHTGGARPMKVFVDKNGNEWICDKSVDPSSGFAAQGCWRTDQMAFDRNF